MVEKQSGSGKVGEGGNQGVGFKRYLVAQINKAMGVLELRKEITSKLEKVDMTVLRAIDAMLDVYTEDESHYQLYEPDGTPVDMDKFHEEMIEAREDVLENGGISLEDFTKKTEQWLNDLK